MSNNKPHRTLNRRSALKLMGTGGMVVGSTLQPWGAVETKATFATTREEEHTSNLPWYGQELIRGHVSWLHPFWTRPEKDFDAAKWIDQLKRAGFGSFVFYAKFHDGACNWPSKLQELKPTRDFVGEIIAEAHRRDVRVIIYYSGGRDRYSADHHFDWRAVPRRPLPVEAPPIGTYFYRTAFCCPNSPYREYALGQIAELFTIYDPDGLWIDDLSFIDGGCFCKWCLEKYAARAGGASLFDIDGTPEQAKWEADCWREFISAAREIVHHGNRGNDRSITFNGCGHLDYSWPSAQALGDYLSVEGSQVQLGVHCRLGRTSGKPYEVIATLSGQTIGWTPKSTDRILLDAATITAHGGTYCCAVDPTASGAIFENQVRQVAEVSTYLRQRRDWLQGAAPACDVAIFQPSPWASPAPEARTSNLARNALGWADAMAERNIPFALLYPDSDLSPYQLVILDAAFPVSEAQMDRVSAYVRNGGCVLAELSPAQLNSPAGDRLLANVLGVRIAGPTPYEAVYLGGLDASIRQTMTEMPTLVEGPSYYLHPVTSEPLAYYTYPIAPWTLEHMTFAFHNPPQDLPSNDPAITLNRHGKGLAMFVGCSLGQTEIRRHHCISGDTLPVLSQVHEWSLQLAENLAARLIPEPLLRSEAPAGVEVVVNQQPGRHIVHLLNNHINPVLFSDNRTGRLILADISCALNQNRVGPVKRVVTIDGEELPVRREGKWAGVTVSRLKVHEVLAFLQ